jgi:hypothetical protein
LLDGGERVIMNSSVYPGGNSGSRCHHRFPQADAIVGDGGHSCQLSGLVADFKRDYGFLLGDDACCNSRRLPPIPAVCGFAATSIKDRYKQAGCAGSYRRLRSSLIRLDIGPARQCFQ